MENKLLEIYKIAKNKYGKFHHITIEVAGVISPFLKKAENLQNIEDSLEEEFEVNIDEIKSLFDPERYNFERVTIGNIGVEK